MWKCSSHLDLNQHWQDWQVVPEVLHMFPESCLLDIISSDEFLLSLTVRHQLAELPSIYFSFIGLFVVWGVGRGGGGG